VFFFLVILDLMALALFMARWGANHQAGTSAAFLAGAQLISYIVPLGTTGEALGQGAIAMRFDGTRNVCKGLAPQVLTSAGVHA
jgi:hypothetical protein